MSKLSVVLPVHNESKTLLKTLKEIDDVLSKYVDFEFILSEDGSVDNTVKVMNDAEKMFNLRFITAKKRKGYARAVVDAIKLVNTEYVIFMDSDGQIDPTDIEALWSGRNKCDINIGFRKDRADSIIRLIYSKSFFYFYKILFHTPLSDPSCPLVLVSKDSAIILANDWSRFGDRLSEGFWWEFNAWALKRSYIFCEYVIKHRRRSDGSDTQVYKPHKMPGIIVRNVLGMLRVKFSSIK
jgi:glycosyltransferase involved in cell wall biosynthesis